MIEYIDSIGITNQRETIVVWDKSTGKPVYNAIVWQCRRTKKYCDGLEKHKETIFNKTGLYIDSYFSASKIKWIFDNVKNIQNLSDKDNIYAGTIDTWIIWNLTKRKMHLNMRTERGNATYVVFVTVSLFLLFCYCTLYSQPY